jgi:uncharacterized membrane protein YebE (DUF533 family)
LRRHRLSGKTGYNSGVIGAGCVTETTQNQIAQIVKQAGVSHDAAKALEQAITELLYQQKLIEGRRWMKTARGAVQQDRLWLRDALQRRLAAGPEGTYTDALIDVLSLLNDALDTGLGSTKTPPE